MSFNFTLTGRLINEGVLVYVKGMASSGSGFKASIFCDAEEQLVMMIDRPNIMRRAGKYFCIVM